MFWWFKKVNGKIEIWIYRKVGTVKLIKLGNFAINGEYIYIFIVMQVFSILMYLFQMKPDSEWIALNG